MFKKLANQRGFAIIIAIVVVIAVAVAVIIVAASRGDKTAEPPTSDQLIGDSYWRLANWEQLGSGLVTDPNPGNCGPDQFSHLETTGPNSTHSCVDRPQVPSQADEEVVESLRVEALDRFNVDTKPRAMRVVSSYVQPTVNFPYRATTPETCHFTWSSEVTETVRGEIDFDNASKYFRPERVSDYSHIISRGCGDWVLDIETLANDYGGAFFYQEAPSRFNVDNVDVGIRPIVSNYPSLFAYQPTSPQTCRYYLADSSFGRAGVNRLFEENAVDGERGFGFAQNTDIGGWYDYDNSPVEISTGHGYTFIISEGCGDWTRAGVDDLPDKRQIFDHPYYSSPFTADN